MNALLDALSGKRRTEALRERSAWSLPPGSKRWTTAATWLVLFAARLALADCPPFPSFPDANCTGVLPGVPRANSGTITTASHGQLIENLNVDGQIVVRHNNVTIRNVRVTNPRGVAITNIGSNTSGLLIEDVELDGTGNTSGASAVDFSNYTLRRAHIHHFGEGPGCDGAVVIEDSYMHSFLNFQAQGAHQDGIQCEFSGGNIIRHNRIEMSFVTGNNGNSAIVFGGSTSNNIAEYNLLIGGAYTLYPGQNGGTVGTFRHNRWGTTPVAPGFGPVYSGYSGGMNFSVVPCDNVWADGPQAGQPVANGGAATCPAATPLTFYVRDGATGSSCSDWGANACDQLPTTLQRGAVYFIADGTYPGRVFNTPVSGIQTISIRKATVADHGSNSGWVDSFGDGQAVFVGELAFDTSFVDFNGVFEYGFKVDFSEGQTAARISAGTAAIQLRYVDFDGISTTGDYNYTASTKCIEMDATVDLLVSHCALHGGESLIQGGGERTIVEHCHFYNARSIASNYHNNVFFLSGGNNGAFRYNRVHDYNAEGLFFTGWSGSPSGWRVYGNAFWSDGGEVFPRGIELRQDYSYSNNEFYNNTFVNLGVGGILNRAPETGHSCTNCIARNNVAYNSAMRLAGMTASNNTDDGVDRFVSLAAKDFRLAAALGGETLSPRYDRDLSGNLRGADGVWDRGAFEFVGPGAKRPGSPSALTVR